MQQTATTKRADEAAAAALAISGTRIERTTVGLQALRNLLRDPDDTHQVFIIGLVLNTERFPMFLARFSATAGGARLLREQPTIDSKSVDFDALRALPADTLGGAYARYLDSNGLDPDLFQAPEGLPEIPAFIARRLRQTHDIWHTLTGYAPDVAGELELQGFTFAQTRMPSSFLIALLGSLRFSRATKGLMKRTFEGFERGREAAFLAPVVWEDHWAEPLDDVRRRYNIRPASEPARATTPPA